MSSNIFIVIIAPLLWSGNFIIGRAIGGELGPLTLASSRWICTTILLLPLLILSAKKIRLSIKQWFHIVIMSLLGAGCYNTFVYIGLQSTPASSAVFYNSLIPFFILIIHKLVFNQKITKRQLVGISLSTIGVFVLISHGDLQQLIHFNVGHGDLWMIASALVWSIYTVLLTKWQIPKLDNMVFLAIQAAIAGLSITIIRYIVNPLHEMPIHWDINITLSIVYVSVAASIIAFYCYMESVKRVGSSKAGQSIHLMPIFVALLGHYFLTEQLLHYHYIGATLIAWGLWMNYQERV